MYSYLCLYQCVPFTSLIQSQKRIALQGPLAALSQTLDGDLGDPNDDDRERLARRRSRLLEDFTLNTEASLTINSAAANRFPNMTSTDMTAHYGDCIKLATENKITFKNAFSLHLIDFIPIMMHRNEIESFQMASSSLDAGAKIYASRVDAVHKEAYKVVTSLGRTAEHPEPQSDEENEAEHEQGAPEGNGEDDDQPGNQPNAKKKAGPSKKKRAILVNPNKIRMKAVQLHSELDPLFQQQAASYDEGGTNFLRLNNIHTNNFPSELMLDSSMVLPLIQSQEATETVPQPTTSNLKERQAVWDFRSIVEDRDTATYAKALRITSRDVFKPIVTVCPQFQNLRFMNWSPSDKAMEGTQPWMPMDHSTLPAAYQTIAGDDEQSVMNAFDAASVISEPPAAPIDDDFDYGDVAEEVSAARANESDVNACVINASHDTDRDRQSVCGDAQELITLMRELCSTSNMSEQADMFGMWAGPSLWRNKCRDINDVKKEAVRNAPGAEDDAEKKSAKKTAKRRRIEFDSLEENMLKVNRNAKGYLGVDYKKGSLDHILRKSKAENVLSQAGLIAHLGVRKRFPAKRVFEPVDLGDRLVARNLDFFLWVQERYLTNVFTPDLVTGTGPELNESVIATYNFQNDFDATQYVPGHDSQKVLEGIAPQDFPMVAEPEDDDDMDENYGAPEGDVPEPTSSDNLVGVPTEPEPIQEVEVYEDRASTTQALVLMEPPRKIQKIEIGFARTAKRVNVKRLKMVLWKFIEPMKIGRQSVSPPQDENRSPALTSLTDALGQAAETNDSNFIMFSQLVRRVPSQFHTSMAEDLSAPVVFTCLLYLANEKTLVVSNSPDYKDLQIRVGSTDVSSAEANAEQDPNLHKILSYARQHGISRPSGSKRPHDNEGGRAKKLRQSTLDEYADLSDSD